ncbi:hypothetical protein F4823DRAFT_266194 [Ustulina deusta]|nr:hypothetical protein F4823DRAFT_266194 [Ustulina deusta]
MSLSVTTLILYLFLAILLPPVLAVVVLFQPYFIPVLGYVPVSIAFMLWIIEDCSHLHPGPSCLLPWWAKDICSEVCTPSGSPTMVCESGLGLYGSVVPDYGADDDGSIMSTQESLLLRYMWSPSQSCVPSSRLSDISLSSSGPDSLPSSWGTLTRIWFPDFPAQDRILANQTMPDAGEHGPFRMLSEEMAKQSRLPS